MFKRLQVGTTKPGVIHIRWGALSLSLRRTPVISAGVLLLLLAPYGFFAAIQLSQPVSPYLQSLGATAAVANQPPPTGKTLVVSHGEPGTYPNITSAIADANPGDVVLIRPGTYNEAVNVSKPWITIRGVDRSGVVLDGMFKLADGIQATQALGISVEDLTVERYTDNGILFFKSDHWLMKGITALDNANYGLFALSSRWGTISDSLAMGGGDSGFYIGETHNCNCLIENSTAYGNTVGYSGTRVDGVTIRDSKFINNSVGVAPNTLLPDFNLVLTGQWTHPYFASNHTIVDNVIADNNNRTVQGTGIGASIGVPIGTGITLAGASGIKVANNQISGNSRWGIAEWYFLIPPTGNILTSNNFSNNGQDIWSDGTSFFGCGGNETGTGDNPPSCDQWAPSRLTMPNPFKEVELILSLGRPSAVNEVVSVWPYILGVALIAVAGGPAALAGNQPKSIAGRRNRVVAAIYDGLLVGVIYLGLASSLVVLEGVSGIVDFVGAVFALTLLLTPLAYFLFVTIWFFYGLILDLTGIRRLGEYVTASHSHARLGVASFPRTLARNLMVYVETLFFGCVGLAFVLAKQKTLGELLTGIYVSKNESADS